MEFYARHGQACGRGLHSSTSHLNLSGLCSLKPPATSLRLAPDPPLLGPCPLALGTYPPYTGHLTHLNVELRSGGV